MGFQIHGEIGKIADESPATLCPTETLHGPRILGHGGRVVECELFAAFYGTDRREGALIPESEVRLTAVIDEALGSPGEGVEAGPDLHAEALKPGIDRTLKINPLTTKPQNSLAGCDITRREQAAAIWVRTDNERAVLNPSISLTPERGSGHLWFSEKGVRIIIPQLQKIRSGQNSVEEFIAPLYRTWPRG
jgi:hypothetical protein